VVKLKQPVKAGRLLLRNKAKTIVQKVGKV